MEKKKSVFEPLDTNPAYYDDWEFRVRMLLNRKGCINAIKSDRPIPNATNSDEVEVFDERDRQALGYITDSALSKVKDFTTSAKSMWDALKRSYENKSICNQLNILTRLINLRMKEGEKIEVHFSVLDTIVSELRLAGAQTATDTPLLTAVLLASMPTSFSQAVTAISILH